MSFRTPHRVEPFLYGGLGCMVAALCTNPLDVVKVRLQLQNQLLSPETPKWGFFEMTKQILQKDGILGLYRGIKASLLREATYSSIRMGGYSFFKEHVFAGLSSPPLIQMIISGAAAGALGSAIANPTDLLKVRDQANPNLEYQKIFRTLKTIYQTEGGLKGLYRGTVPTTSRAIILTATQLPTYDYTKQALKKKGGFHEGPLLHFLSSMISGLATATTTSPFDLVKSRVMNDKEGSRLYKGPIDCLVKTIRAEGPFGLFKGWLPNWIRIGPHTLITMLVCERLRRLAGLAPV